MPIPKALENYLEGWRTGDAQKCLESTLAHFTYDDPATGRVHRAEFVDFIEAFKKAGAEMGDGEVPSPFLIYTDVVVTGEDRGTVWCWWRVNGTDFQGSALVRFDETGVLSARISYFTSNPMETPIPQSIPTKR